MKKPFVIIIGISIIILTILLLSIGSFQSTQPNSDTGTNALPTRTPFNRTNRTFVEPTLSASQRKLLQLQEQKLLQSKPLTQAQIDALQRLKNAIGASPVKNADFEISYSKNLDKFYIRKKSSSANQKLAEYFASDPNLQSVYNNDIYDYFETVVTSPETAIDQDQSVVDDYQQTKYEQSGPSGPPTPTLTSLQERQKNQQASFGKFMQTAFSFKAPLSTPAQKVSLALPGGQAPTGQPPAPDQTAPSNLDALFAEAGERVGVPAAIIKAVMAHECGVLLSESPANILAWSQPGAGLPNTHKCFDGGIKKGDGLDLGPMQFYIVRYFETYSQAVNQFGHYNRPSPYVENIVDAVYASAYKLKLDSQSPDTTFSCKEVKRASWCYACGCSRYDSGNLNDNGCRFAPGLFQYLWGYYTEGKPASQIPSC